jgi:uncharacterized membrane-anchored protein
VWQKEQLLKTGKIALIKLAPADPRSLIQSDYKVLNYTIPSTINAIAKEQSEGLMVYTLNSQQVITLRRIADENETLHNGEKLIRFRYRKRQLQLGANRFLFQEGKAKIFEKAIFGEVRIDKSGNVILVGLRDKKYQLLGITSGLN